MTGPQVHRRVIHPRCRITLDCVRNGPAILGNDMPGWLVTACRLTDGVVEHALISAAHRANSIGCRRD
jgi:hypothetical protein